jgi:hypothetical protein
MMQRFTVLRHRVGPNFQRGNATGLANPIAAGPIHWDWLFEPPEAAAAETSNGRLWTWATNPVPTRTWESVSDRLQIDAIRLPDHRARYLDYEGEVSDNRGHVERQISGLGSWSTIDPDHHRFQIDQIVMQRDFFGLKPTVVHLLRRTVEANADEHLWRLQIDVSHP